MLMGGVYRQGEAEGKTYHWQVPRSWLRKVQSEEPAGRGPSSARTEGEVEGGRSDDWWFFLRSICFLLEEAGGVTS